MIQDREIMLSVKEGNTHELGLLFDRHARGLFNYFRFQVRDRHKSEDLVQNVFYKILKYRHTFKDGADFKVWMYAIARNEKIDHFKKERPQDQALDPDLSDEWSQSPEKKLEEKAEKKLLDEALERVSPDNRELIVLSKFTALPYRQIAELYGCTVGAIKVRIYRAIKELKAQYSIVSGE